MDFLVVHPVYTTEDKWASDLSLPLGAHAQPCQLLLQERIPREESDLIWRQCVTLQIICWSRYAIHYQWLYPWGLCLLLNYQIHCLLGLGLWFLLSSPEYCGWDWSRHLESSIFVLPDYSWYSVIYKELFVNQCKWSIHISEETFGVGP